ncbi:MAG: hypothetical protein IPK65_00260 [Gammaproteobacteria bacterium]|nr:hypothetical protein [Gammaproteobacteria bacterium]
MILPRSSLNLGLCLMLACPLAVYGQDLMPGTADTAGGSPAPLQLAAAIGIVKPAQDAAPVPPPEVPAPPVVEPPAAVVAPEPAPEVQQAQIPVEDADAGAEGATRTVTTKQVLIGAGIAALLGAVAGGGGGGSSSTPSH